MEEIKKTEVVRMGRMSMASLALILALMLSNFILTKEASADIAQRGTATTATVTNNASLIINKPTGVVSGDVMIANLVQVNSLTPPTAPAGWTLIDHRSLAGGTARYASVFYKVAGGAEGGSYTFTVPTGATVTATGAIVAFSCVDTTGGFLVGGGTGGPFDVAPGIISVQASSTAVAATSITTATANAAVIMLGQAAASAPTWSGWTTTSPGTLTEVLDFQGTNTTIGAAWAIKATAGATGAGAATLSGAERNGGILLALKPISPTVTSTSPNGALQGTTNLIVTINGTNFVNGANASFSSTGITVNSTNFVNSTQLTANITIAASATIGTSNVTVTNPSGCSGTGTGVFNVFAAFSCASSGSAGPATISGVVNTYYPATASVAAGASTITLGAAAGATTPIVAGDLLIVIQMQDADISSANDASYGAGTTGGSGYTALNSAGLYEYVQAAGGVPLTGGTLTITSGLVNSYRDRNYVAGSNGQSSFQVIRVPQYSVATVAVATTLTAPAWNGTTGGVVVIDVAGTLTIDGSIVADGIGFRGGMGRQHGGANNGTYLNTDYVTFSFPNLGINQLGANGSKGEGIAGTPRYVNQPASFNAAPNQIDTGVEGYPNGSYGRGAPGNAGGGSTDGDPAPNQPNGNDQNSGGGGGGNYGSGAQGGNSWNSNLAIGGDGGSTVSGLAFNRVVMGGGGGAGTTNNGSAENLTFTNPAGNACDGAVYTTGQCSSGAPGGGIIILRANLFAGAGSISAQGGTAYNVGRDSAGGGGAGGSIVLYSQLGGTANAYVNGGDGGNAWRSGGTNWPADRHGPGGGGGGGFLAYSPSSGFNITINVAGGISGKTTTSNDPYGTTSSAGGIYVFDYTVIPGLQSSANCLPALTVSKSTTTSSISGLPGTATYKISVTNSGSATAEQVTISDTLPGVPALFIYNSSTGPTITYSPNSAPCNTSRTSTVNPATDTSTPSWSSWDIPANCTVNLTFNATVPSGTVPAVYQNPATATYLDPQRTIPTGTISITYNPASSTAEDVTVIAPPSISKAFASSPISAGGNTLLTVTLNNTNPTPITAVGFTDTLPTIGTGAPGNMTILNPLAPSTICGGTFNYTAVNGSGSFTVSNSPGLTIPANSSCTVSFTVTAPTAGIYTNTIAAGAVSSSAGANTDPATASLSVGNVLLPPTITKSFSTNPVLLGATTTLTFTLKNPNVIPAIGSAGFIDTLPTEIVIASAPNVVNNCGGGTVTAAAGTNYISLNTNGTIPANGTCTVSVDVVGVSAGLYHNTSGQVVGDTGAGNRATADLRVMTPLLVAKSFPPNPVAPGASTVLSIQLTNPNSIAVTGAAFTDTYPSGLVNTATPNPTITGVVGCAGTVTAPTSPDKLALAGGNIPANSSCTVTVNVQSSISGYYTNSTGQVTTANAGSSNSASATLSVLSPPVVQKSFIPTAIPSPGGQSSMLIVITNPSSNPTSLTGVAVSDTYTGTMTNAAAASVTCTSGSFTSLTGGANGGTSVGILNGTILPGGACRIIQSVTATTDNTNTTTAPTFTNGGGGTGIAATAYLKIIKPLMVSKTFAVSHPAANTDDLMTITLTNPNEVTVNNVSFTDNYTLAGTNFINSPTAPNPQFSPANCAGAAASITGGVASGTTIGLSAGSIAANTSCSITVNVQLSANNIPRANSTGTVTTSNAGTSPGDTATISDGTGVAAVELTKSFSPAAIIPGGTTTLTFSIKNPHTANQTAINFTDTLPAGVTATNVGTTNICNAGNYTITFGNLITVSGVQVNAGVTCTFSINTVTSSASSVYNNRTTQIVSSAASGNYAEAVLTVYYPPSVSKFFGTSTLAPGAKTTLTISIANPNPIPFTLSSNFDDTFPISPGAMTLADGTVTNNTCGVTPVNTSGGALSAGNTGVRIPNGSTIPAGGCHYTVDVTANTAGTFTNTITAGALHTSAGDNAVAASAQLTVPKLAPMVSKTFVPASINPGGTSTLLITFLNPNATSISLSTLFTDTFPTGVPTGVVTAGTPNYSTTCSGGTAGGTAGTITLSSGAVIPAGTFAIPGSCTLKVDVTAAVSGIYTNTIHANDLNTTAGYNTSDSSAVLTVKAISPPTVSKAFDAVAIGNTTGLVSKLTLTLSNTNSGTATLSADMVDNFPDNLLIATPAGVTGTCTGTVTTTNIGAPLHGRITYASGATIPSGGCTITVNVTSSVVATYLNTIHKDDLKTDLGNNPGDTSDTIIVYPTLISLSDFSAYNDDGRVRVEWTTSSEINTAGFFLFRLDESTGRYSQINRSLLPAVLNSQQGGTYSLIDNGASLEKGNTYVLVEIEGRGTRNSYGPFTVIAGGSNAVQSQYTSGSKFAGAFLSNLDRPVVNQAKRITRYVDSEGTIVITNSGGRSSSGPENTVTDEISDYRMTPKAVSANKIMRLSLRKEAKAQDRSMQSQKHGAMIKIAIEKDGLYYISSAELSRLTGMSQEAVKDAIRRASFALSNQGNPVAYLPAGDNSGLYFYGQGTDSIYTKDNIYWVYNDNGMGLKMGRTGGKGPASVEGLTFTDTVHAEQNHIIAAYPFMDPEADFWFWDRIVAGYPEYDTKTFTIETNGAAGIASTATLTANLQGITDTPADPDHHVQVSVNGTVLYNDDLLNWWNVRWNGTEKHSSSFEFSQLLLNNGPNTIEVKGLLDTGAPWSLFYIDSFDLSYQRLYEAVDNVLLVKGDANPTVTVRGFTGPDILVFDVTDPVKPVLRTATTIEPYDGKYSASFVPASPASVYLAITADAATQITDAWVDSPSHLRDRNNHADYIIIAPEELIAGAQELAAYRQTKGLSTMIVNVENIMDEFNYGLSSPKAIQAFLTYAYNNWNWPPKYVVLAGDGTYDYRNYLNYSENLVPTMVVKTPDGLFTSDNILADVNGDHVPEMAIGRLPVMSPEELHNVIAKIIAYERNAGNHIVMLADNPDVGGNFHSDSDDLAAIIPSTYKVKKIYLSKVTKIYLSQYQITDARQMLFSEINSGTSLINYMGHASSDNLAAEDLLDISDVASLSNSTSPFVLSAMTCMVGQYAFPGADSLSETLMLKKDGGASAVWAPSGLAFNSDSKLLAQYFLGTALKKRGMVLGSSILNSFRNFYKLGGSSYVFDIYNLQGDPALKLW
jgi:uncharacterized repeat protein (TIGR01451 family)